MWMINGELLVCLIFALGVLSSFILERCCGHLPPTKRSLWEDTVILSVFCLGVLWYPSSYLYVIFLGGVLYSLWGLYCYVAKKDGIDVLLVELLIGIFIALLGVRISFLRLPDGQYYYFSLVSSVLLTSLWFVMFGRVMLILDRIPGLAGNVSFISVIVILAVVVLQKQGLYEAMFFGFLILFNLIVFRKRFLSFYSHLGQSISRFLGFMIASVSILGVSKSAVAVFLLVPLVMFSVPLVEFSVSFVSNVYAVKQGEYLQVYRKLLSLGLSHIEALFVFLFFTFYLGVSATLLIFNFSAVTLLIIVISGLISFVSVLLLQRKESTWMTKKNVMGILFDNLTSSYAISKISKWIEKGEKGKIVVTPDSLAIIESRKNKAYKDVLLNKASMVLPDGWGVVWASKLLGQPLVERVSGIDILEKLCVIASDCGWRIFLLGGKKGVSEAAAKRLKEKYKGINIVGCFHGYFTKEETKKVLEMINSRKPHILFVGMGVPKQELWIAENVDSLDVNVIMGVGGSFDVISGRLKRAPLWMQKAGLEWFFRMLQEPWRIKRVIKLPLFVLLVLGHLLKSFISD